jgi:hypothetical protein
MKLPLVLALLAEGIHVQFNAENLKIKIMERNLTTILLGLQGGNKYNSMLKI